MKSARIFQLFYPALLAGTVVGRFSDTGIIKPEQIKGIFQKYENFADVIYGRLLCKNKNLWLLHIYFKNCVAHVALWEKPRILEETNSLYMCENLTTLTSPFKIHDDSICTHRGRLKLYLKLYLSEKSSCPILLLAASLSAFPNAINVGHFQMPLMSALNILL